MHTSGTVTCMGVSSYLLHYTYVIGVKLQANARSTMRRITNSALSKQSARLGTMESTFCDVRPSEKANCAFVSTTSVSLRHERSGNVMHSCNRCRATHGTNTSCSIALMIVLCIPATVGMAVALRQAQCSLRRSKQVAPHIARCSVLVFRTLACLSQCALHVHQPVITCCGKHHAAAQTSSSFISDTVELNSFA